MRHTDSDFEQLSWHDCHIWGLEFRVGDPDEKDWTSDLLIRLDFIVEWISGVNGAGQFRLAPAELAFHGVTDPRVAIAWGDSGYRTALHLLSIDTIERTHVPDQQVFLDRAYYRWRILLNWPSGGEMSFGAVGFTQSLLAEAVLTDRQCLTRHERSNLLRAMPRSGPT